MAAGETKLFQTDSLKLTKAVAIARQDLMVSQCSVEEKQALLEKDVAACAQAQNDMRRYRELHVRNAIATQVFEKQEVQCKQCDADVKHTEAPDRAGSGSVRAGAVESDDGREGLDRFVGLDADQRVCFGAIARAR